VCGDTVANGFAIEVEDRGLGMSPQRLAELNERLARPPEFNPSDSEQLGLFVVSQLAKRHGIRVTLRASPYGGTAAVVLIPQHLVVTEDAFRAALPGEPVAIGTAAPSANGNHAPAALAGSAGLVALRDVPELGVPEPPEVPETVTAESAGGTGQQPAFDVFMPRRRAQDTGEAPAPAEAGPEGEPGQAGSRPGVPAGGTGMPHQPSQAASYISAPPYSGGSSAPDQPAQYPDQPAPYPDQPAQYPDQPAQYPDQPAQYPDQPAQYPDQPAPFPGWTSRGTSSGPAVPGRGAPLTSSTTPMVSVASPRTGKPSGPPWELSRQTGPLPVVPDEADPGSQTAGPGAEGGVQGLPRRVKQANLAPQLRANPPRRVTASAGGGLANGPTPAEIRKTMSALQRGWQEGRSQRPAGPAPGEQHTAGPAPGEPPSERPAVPGPLPDARGREPAADDEPSGESDGA
jgi:hypothetical protein